MADVFQWQASDAVKSILESTLILGELPTVEYQRLYDTMNDRFPYIMLLGPVVDLNPKLVNISNAEAHMAIRTYIKYNDEANTTEPITSYTRNVNRDIIVALQQDETLGGLCDEIEVYDMGGEFEIVDEDNEVYYLQTNISMQFTVDNKTLKLFE